MAGVSAVAAAIPYATSGGRGARLLYQADGAGIGGASAAAQSGGALSRRLGNKTLSGNLDGVFLLRNLANSREATNASRFSQWAKWVRGDRSDFLIHYTGEREFNQIVQTIGNERRFVLKSSPKELSTPGPGVFFTDAGPYPFMGEQYNRFRISAGIGVPVERTQYYIAIDPKLLPDSKWFSRHKFTDRPEFGLRTLNAYELVDITQAVISYGSTSTLR
jgi:hypothetical protein